MSLTVRLDAETERCLRELLDETGQDKSSLIRQLIQERWQLRVPLPSITEQLGGHPASFLTTLPAGSAERTQRRHLLDQQLKARCRRRIRIDSGILLSDYQQQEPLHQAVVAFFDTAAAQLITSPICIAAVLWLLGDPGDSRVRAAQNHLLNAVAAGGIQVMDLLPEDYARIAELNERDADLPGDVADLTLVALSERLNLAEILTLDSDFDVYRRFRREPFCRVPLT